MDFSFHAKHALSSVSQDPGAPPMEIYILQDQGHKNHNNSTISN